MTPKQRAARQIAFNRGAFDYSAPQEPANATAAAPRGVRVRREKPNASTAPEWREGREVIAGRLVPSWTLSYGEEATCNR